MVKKDLAEFGCTMQKDAGHAVAVTSSTFKESLKTENTSAARDKVSKGLNALLEGISKALTVPPDDEGQIPITRGSAAGIYDRAKARLHAIQIDPDTYIQPPSGPPETFTMWCSGFDLESVKGEISELLVSKVEVRGLYTKLVPAEMSHVDFWQRYFYKVHQVQIDQARKEALMMRAEQSRTDDPINWDDDWSGDEEDQGSDWERLPRAGEPASAISVARGADRQVEAAVSSIPDGTALREENSVHVVDLDSCALSPVQETQTENLLVNMDKEQNFSQVEDAMEREQNLLQVEVVSAAAHLSASTALDSCVQQESTDAALVLPNHVEPEVQTPVNLSSGSASCEQKLSPNDHVALTVMTNADASPLEASETKKVTPGDSKESVPTCVGIQDQVPQSVSPLQQAEEVTATPLTTLSEIMPEASPPCSPLMSATPTAELSSQVCLPDAMPSSSSSRTQQEPSQPSPMISTFSPMQEATVSLAVAVEGRDIKTTIKGDIVLVGSDHGSPVSTTSDPKDVSADEDWEQDLDIELTEEDMKAAEELAKKMGENIDLEDDWENWE